ncbi:MAG TPA: hypothetical protein VKA08_00575 [Balneolales bacterium]|nr:hypothetical protein [Balneolales bacterium]
MRSRYIPLLLTAHVTGTYLNPVSGASEILVEDTSTRTALDFLASLIAKTDPADAGTHFQAADVVTADRDRILAALYKDLFGDLISGTLNCVECGKPYDLDFSLTDLLDHYALQPMTVEPDGSFSIGPDIRFRLPTGEDELLLENTDPMTAESLLLQRCVNQPVTSISPELIQEHMNKVAPLLHIEMEARCPECNASQTLQFDMQHYFLEKMIRERPVLLRDIHLIASHYHWSDDSILALPRPLRKQYVQMIEADSVG